MRRELPPSPAGRGALPTRNDILERADELIRRKGFNAFSYADIAGVLEIRNSAIHYHFPTKSGLGQAVIDRELERLREYRSRFAAMPGDEQLKDLVAVFYRNSQMGYICLMGSLLPDFETFEGGMQEKVSEMCDTILGWVTDSLEKARKKGRIRFDGAAGDRAALFISTLLSSLLLSRVQGPAVFRRMVDRLLEDLGAGWRTGDLPQAKLPATEESYSFTSKIEICTK